MSRTLDAGPRTQPVFQPDLSLYIGRPASPASKRGTWPRDRLLAAGETNKGIAANLGIGERTARTHVSHILSKLGLTSRTQAALWATREGLADAGADPEARAADQL